MIAILELISIMAQKLKRWRSPNTQAKIPDFQRSTVVHNHLLVLSWCATQSWGNLSGVAPLFEQHRFEGEARCEAKHRSAITLLKLIYFSNLRRTEAWIQFKLSAVASLRYFFDLRSIWQSDRAFSNPSNYSIMVNPRNSFYCSKSQTMFFTFLSSFLSLIKDILLECRWW